MTWEYLHVTYQHGQAPQYQGWNVSGRIVQEFSGLSAEGLLNALGEDGWELVSVFADNVYPDPAFYLKRPK